MDRASRSLVRLALIAALGAACSDNPRALPQPPTPSTLERVEIRPAVAMLTKGATVALTAQAIYSDESTKDVTTRATWSSRDPMIATVVGGGVTSRAVGRVEIVATFEEKVGSATIDVRPVPLQSLALTPANAIIDVGGTTSFTATGTFEDGSTDDVTASVAWSTSSTIATIAGGVVAGVAGGTVTITARDAATGVEATASVTIRPRIPVSVSVTPSGVMLALGLTQQYAATALFGDGMTMDVTGIVGWASSNPAAATVDAAGLATSVAEGLTSITASYPGGPRGSTTLAVGRPTLVALEITPRTATIATGQRQTFTAEGRYTNNTTRDLTFVVMWASSDPGIIAIGGMDRNVARPVGTGTVTISAVDPMSGASTDTLGSSARLRVLPPTLTGIVVTPSAARVPFGATQQFRADGLFSDNTSRELTASVTWSSSMMSVATIAAGGLATSVGQGATRIIAVDPVTGVSSEQTPNGTAALTVDPPALLSLSVTPAVWAMVIGGTHQFTATGLFSDGMSRDVTSMVEWRSSGAAVTVGATGFATAQSTGVVTISARDTATMISSDTTMQSARVTSSAAQLVSIALVPTSTSVPAGAEAQIRAIGTYDNAATADLTNEVVWSVVTSSVADIGNTAGLRGRVFRTRAGATRVSAREPSTGISSGPTARVNVTASPTLSALTIEPRSAIVNIGRTRGLAARGRFSDGSIFAMTNTVDWTSSNPTRATVGNTDGTRGRVTGVAVGTTDVSAIYTPTGLSAAPPAQITVDLGVVTLGRDWLGPTVSVDATPTFGVQVGSVSFAASDFGPGALVSDVNIAINFLKTDGSCAVPLGGNAFHNEANFRLRGPTGATVVLAPSGTWSGGVAIAPVTVVFDDAAPAAPNGTPVSGTFRPNEVLSAFNGTAPAGTWILEAGDSGGGDPLCVIAYTVTVTAQ